MISQQHRAAGANIKGTPAMPASAVRHDLRVLRKRATVLMLQEFRWPWYWSAAARVLGAFWSSAPGFAAGLGAAVRGAQGVLWRRSAWRRVESRTWPAFDFDVDTSGIMENRWIRAVLLEDRQTRQACWFLSTHFVVGGDRATDGPVRRALLRDNMARLGAVLDALAATGHPVVGELDANIARDSEAFATWARLLRGRSATVHGVQGVEYLFTVNASTKVLVDDVWEIPTTDLRTDHETRGITFRLIG